DRAGNVSKRLSSGTFPFSKFGGPCPLWNVHATFETPDRIITQIVEMPDGARYFSIAQTVQRAAAPYGEPQPRYAIGLGCELKYVPRLVYSAGLDLDKAEATPIGVNCRLCERMNCGQRAEPPLTRPLVLDEAIRGISPFRFELAPPEELPSKKPVENQLIPPHESAMTSILWPMLAHIGWVAMLYAWLTVARMQAVTRGDIDYSCFVLGREEPLEVARITRNLTNQFEWPVM